jgi:hypothetical protein
MNGPNGSKISPAQTGPAKVFAVFPIVPISLVCSVCYRLRRAIDEGRFRFPHEPSCRHSGTRSTHRFLPPAARLF